MKDPFAKVALRASFVHVVSVRVLIESIEKVNVKHLLDTVVVVSLAKENLVRKKFFVDLLLILRLVQDLTHMMSRGRKRPLVRELNDWRSNSAICKAAEPNLLVR